MVDASLTSCRLGFINRWSVENHLWGVAVAGSDLEINRKAFSCCGGDGLVIESLVRREAKLCGLTQRWHLLTNVPRQIGLAVDQRAAFWNQILMKAPSSDLSSLMHEAQEIVGSHLDRWLNASKGGVFSSRHSGTGASVLDNMIIPLVGSILSWHFGRIALIAKPGEIQLPVNLWQELLNKHPSSRALMLVDVPQDLWNPSKLEPMEGLIAFAYERKIPIWLRSSATNAPRNLDDREVQRKSRSFRQSVSQRLEHARGKSFLEWLSSQSLSRLSEICDLPVVVAPVHDIPDFT